MFLWVLKIYHYFLGQDVQFQLYLKLLQFLQLLHQVHLFFPAFDVPHVLLGKGFLSYRRAIPCQITEKKPTGICLPFFAIISKYNVKLGICNKIKSVLTKMAIVWPFLKFHEKYNFSNVNIECYGFGGFFSTKLYQNRFIYSV